MKHVVKMSVTFALILHRVFSLDGILIDVWHVLRIEVRPFSSSFHITSSIQSLTNSRISSKVMGSWRWKPSLSVVVISQQSFALWSRFRVTLPLIAKGSKSEVIKFLFVLRIRLRWLARLGEDEGLIIRNHGEDPPSLLPPCPQGHGRSRRR